MRQIGVIVLRGFLWCLSLLPLKVHYALAGFLAFLASDVLHYRRDVVNVNLSRSFPEKKYDELKRIRKQFYKHFGDILAEAVWSGGPHGGTKQDGHYVVEIENPDELHRLYEACPSVVLMTSHLGNWELTGELLSTLRGDAVFNEKTLRVIYKALSSKVWDAVMATNRIANAVDSKHYDGYIESSRVLRYAIEHRNEKFFYIMIADQYPYEGTAAAVEVNDFLHQKTVSMGGSATLAHKYGLGVAYFGMRSISRGHYSVRIEIICDDASKMSSREVLDKYYELLQKDIEAQPWNYLWTHKRWK